MERKLEDISISQSLMKSLFEYVEEKECGLQFEAKYIKGMLFPSSPIQLLGQWFEYEAVGTPPKGGLVPLPDTTTKGELTAPYKKMKAQVENWKRLADKYKIKIINKGRRIVAYDKAIVPNPLDGTTDLELEITIVKKDGTEIHYPYAIGDLKSSGLLYDKWNDYGWDLERLSEKHKLILQPIHYKYIRMLEASNEPEPPFFFFLFSNTNDIDHRIIHFNIDAETEIQSHRLLIQKTVKELAYHFKRGFAPLPEVARCNDCPLKVTCKHFTNVPSVEDFYLNKI
jgi:hypothetical protein